jgi:hypothetical protein
VKSSGDKTATRDIDRHQIWTDWLCRSAVPPGRTPQRYD